MSNYRRILIGNIQIIKLNRFDILLISRSCNSKLEVSRASWQYLVALNVSL